MTTIPIKNVDVNRFWDKTPTPLKYVLVVTLIIATAYFVFMKKVYVNQSQQIEQLVTNMKVTYELVDNFETFKNTQDNYNKEFLIYMNNLYDLVQELNQTTNKKLDMIVGTTTGNRELLEKIGLLNDSFEKLSKVYQELANTKIIQQNSPLTPPQQAPEINPKAVNKKTGEVYQFNKK